MLCTVGDTSAGERFRAARDFLLEHATDYDGACTGFEWPQLEEFNWALDWFDAIARGNRAPALRIVEDGGSRQELSFDELSRRSSRVAAWLAGGGVGRGDKVLLMLGQRVELWESLLACAKLGAVVVPTATLLSEADLADRIERGGIGHIIASSEAFDRLRGVPAGLTRIVVAARAPTCGQGAAGQPLAYPDAATLPDLALPPGTTHAKDALLLYFTSGTTAKPKLVEHTHYSAPVGHLSTMYWIGLRPGDVHLNLSSPGWAKHSWSSFYAPFNAEATVLAYNYERFDARRLLAVLAEQAVTTFCAPPTVWRMLVQEDLRSYEVTLRDAVSAGEPLNPEVIGQVRDAWGFLIRDGYGQSETTALVGNPPGQRVKLGSMGRPLPGYRIELIDPVTGEPAQVGPAQVGPAQVGEVAVDLRIGGRGVMAGYRTSVDAERLLSSGEYYRTGDIASRDEDGWITYVGRTDEVFKSADYRISPFELESVLIEHPAVAEAAVVPSPDPLRLCVPKGYVVLAAGYEPCAETAADILGFVRGRVAPFQRIRRLEFAELPKTISGKIRRVELRAGEEAWRAEHGAQRRALEFWEGDAEAT
ncbi:MAG TPA: AMP-binding protein [Acidimicrobiales bacterium]|nr:AMP-binding protein [Acidimicrobiales bacterium]